MIEDLKVNLEQEKRIVSNLKAIMSNIKSEEDKKFYRTSTNSLLNQLKILNNSIPAILESISPAKSLSQEIKTSGELVQLTYVSPVDKEKKYVSVNKKDKSAFIKDLQVSESALSSLKKSKANDGSVVVNKPSELARVSSMFFSKTSEKLAPKFTGLSDDLKKANIRFLTSTYISISLFVSSIVFLLGIVLLLLMIITNLSLISFIWLPFLLVLLSFTGFYFYPAIEKGSVQKRILQELPFATIHMSAIAGSNIEPTKIFKIIAESSEYPTIGLEIRKLINQTDLYGYDLVTALKNSARQTSNAKLAEMFNGLATNISSGGNLKNYLEKKSENFLMDYKLERQRYTDLAGTFMDVYISIMITAPLILMMMFIVMNVSGIGVGISIDTLLVLSIVGLILLNIIFIAVIELKQPKN